MSSTFQFICICILWLIVGFMFGFTITSRIYTNDNMFCPECGRHYHAVVYCEYDGTQLKEIQK